MSYSSYGQECLFFFFFQAEDGIRDVAVTGVQTCALPISTGWLEDLSRIAAAAAGTARAGKRVAELAHGIADQAGTIGGGVGEAEGGGPTPHQEAEGGGGPAAGPREAIARRPRGARELAAL